MKLKTITAIFLAAIVISAKAQPCMQPAIKSVAIENFTATRSGSLMLVSMRCVLDSLKLRSNQTMVLTPVIACSTDTAPMPRILINGRKQHLQFRRGKYLDRSEGDIVVRRKNGTAQSVDYTATLPYQPWMKNYTAVVVEDDCGCGKINAANSEVVEVGKAFTPRVFFITPPAEPKEYSIAKRSYIDFPVDKIELYPTYRRNPIELDSIINTINVVKNDPNITIDHITIHGYASPESPFDHNDYLASNRAKTLKDYVRMMVKLPDSKFSTAHTPEDWEGLCRYIADSDLEQKEDILAICNDSTLHPDECEKQIRTLFPRQYTFMLATWYPALRHSDYRINYTVRSFTVEEAKALIKTKPQQLSLNELYLVAQTYEPGSADFNEVMEIAVRLHPDDEYANLNAACTRLLNDDIEGAKRYIRKAGNSPEAINARGVIAYYDGDLATARLLFKESGLGNEF